jgi:hypothetical protein
MEAPWDILCREEENELESPKWHESILSDRKRMIESGEANFLSMDDVKKRLLR